MLKFWGAPPGTSSFPPPLVVARPFPDQYYKHDEKRTNPSLVFGVPVPLFRTSVDPSLAPWPWPIMRHLKKKGPLL